MHRSVKIAFFWIFMAFLSLIVATVITVRHATDQKISVVDKDYYEKGLNYEKAIEGQKQMKAEGYEFSGEMFTPGYSFRTGKNEVTVKYSRKGQPVADSAVSMILERSATDDFNVHVKMQHFADGRFLGVLEIPDTGEWLLTVNGKVGSRTFQQTLKLNVEK